MNESKYPKSLSILLALNLCALLVTLIFSMETFAREFMW